MPLANSPARNLLYNRKDIHCMNCGRILDPNASGVDARRFCSAKCKEEYMYGQ